MELNDALTQIADIRGQIARAGTFRGYRSVPTAISGLVALIAAAIQDRWVSDPYRAFDAYLYIWFFAAMFSLATVALEMTLRLRRSGCAVQREMSFAAAEQFIPCMVAGLLLTYVMAMECPGSVWMLPGLWMILFSLGVFSSRRFVPRLGSVVGGFYMLAGLVVLYTHTGLDPWVMGLTFGAGQFAMAALFYLTLERRHVSE